MTAKKITVALGQMDCATGDAEENGRTASGLIDRAAGQGANVVVLPEMADLGYSLNEVATKASELKKNSFLALVTESAKRQGLTVVVGVTEKTADNKCYNTVVVVAPSGEFAATYQKVHLFGSERKHYSPGTNLTITDIAGVRSGIMTCYDIRFPEMARALMLKKVKILYVPAAFPLKRVNHWQTLTEARAIENQFYVVAVNRVGSDGPEHIAGGRSRVVDPYGIVIADSPETEERLTLVEIDLSRVDRTRSSITAIDDRRPDLYSSWAKARHVNSSV